MIRSNRHRWVFALIILTVVAAPSPWASAQEDTISLAGKWDVSLDPHDAGLRGEWFGRPFMEKISLPGSTDEAELGTPVTARHPYRLTRPYNYEGVVWYSRSINIPERWAGHRVTLFLERAHWETRVWLDGKEIGMVDSLAVPHRHTLGEDLEPGEHWLSVRVDNQMKYNVGINAHSFTEETQSNWNGLIGKLELRAEPLVRVSHIRTDPSVKDRSVALAIEIENGTDRPRRVQVRLKALSGNLAPRHEASPIAKEYVVQPGTHVFKANYRLGKDALLWSEFSPAVYRLEAALKTLDDGPANSAPYFTRFGLREIALNGTSFALNGEPYYPRGTLECCIFPLTGYPPMETDGWDFIMDRLKAHGLNHLRFHSWTPPKAAFIAADRAGITFQVECGAWTRVGDGEPIDQFIYDEGDRILREYGNHPSFCFMAYGNEPGGSNHKRYLGDLILSWMKKDDRRLYTSAAGWPVIPENQFHNIPAPRIHRWGANLNDRINSDPPETVTDYSDHVKKYEVPIISHEIGQWCVYPNFDEIKKYKGVHKARNFEIFRQTLRDNHMGDLARDFLMASGKLQVLCYKEEIESALRTPGFGGFQLLDLHDFPGQGTALVGVLDPFWDSKPYVSPEEYRRFTGPVVPLALMEKRIWTSDQIFQAGVKLYNYGQGALKNVRLNWSIKTQPEETVIGSGAITRESLAVGLSGSLGEIMAPLRSVEKASQARLEITVDGTEYHNDWDIWVYPPKVDTSASEAVVIRRALDEETLVDLEKGKRVLLIPHKGTVRGDERGKVPPGFSSIFWNTAWTNNQAPHTLGLLVDTDHPALERFPTEYHTDWQWWDIISKSQIMILDDLPAKARPLVRVVDDWFTNRRLGLILEARVGKGKLLLCGADLLSDQESRPVARQLYHSLIRYMSGRDFDPSADLTPDDLGALFTQPPRMVEYGGKVIHVDSQSVGNEGRNAIDGDPQTIWHSSWEVQKPDYPHEIVIALDREARLKGLTYLPRQNMRNGWIRDYEIYTARGDNPPKASASWGRPVAEGRIGKLDKNLKTIAFEKTVPARYIRFVAARGIENQIWAAIAELDLLIKD